MQSMLLVQDLQPISAAMRDVLALEYELHIALDGAQALDMVKKGQVVVVALADIHHPGRLALLRELVVRDFKVIALIEPQIELAPPAENLTSIEEKYRAASLQLRLQEKKKALIRACVALGAHGIVEWGEDGEVLGEAVGKAIGDVDGNVLLFNIATVCTGARTYPMSQLTEALAFYVEHLPSMSRSSMAILNAILHNPQLDDAAVASVVGLSIGRVKNLFSILLKKFSARTQNELVDAAMQRGYFIGLDLVFPRGLNVHANQIRTVNGQTKYEIAL